MRIIYDQFHREAARCGVHMCRRHSGRGSAIAKYPQAAYHAGRGICKEYAVISAGMNIADIERSVRLVDIYQRGYQQCVFAPYVICNDLLHIKYAGNCIGM